MLDYEVLKQQKDIAVTGVKNDLRNLNKIAKESGKTADIAKHSHIIINELDTKFSEVTSLNNFDISFLFFAVALQCTRQYILTKFPERTGHIESGKKAHKQEQHIFNLFKHTNNQSNSLYYASLNDIIMHGVPYDTISGGAELGLCLSGNTHRFRTLGHDPILGWLFGTSNIMTNTLTDWSFTTYHVQRSIHEANFQTPKITMPAQTSVMFDNVFKHAQEEPRILAAAIIKQGLHLKSDEYSKIGLPLPGISVLSPELSQKLAESGMDAGNLAIVGKQLTFSWLINVIVAMIHGLYYDPSIHISNSAYRIKTNKIINYSNVIASSSNLVFSVITQKFNTLDVGGIILTLYQLISNTAFRQDIEKEFLEKEFYNIVMGSGYDF